MVVSRQRCWTEAESSERTSSMWRVAFERLHPDAARPGGDEDDEQRADHGAPSEESRAAQAGVRGPAGAPAAQLASATQAGSSSRLAAGGTGKMPTPWCSAPPKAAR